MGTLSVWEGRLICFPRGNIKIQPSITADSVAKVKDSESFDGTSPVQSRLKTVRVNRQFVHLGSM